MDADYYKHSKGSKDQFFSPLHPMSDTGTFIPTLHSIIDEDEDEIPQRPTANEMKHTKQPFSPPQIEMVTITSPKDVAREISLPVLRSPGASSHAALSKEISSPAVLNSPQVIHRVRAPSPLPAFLAEPPLRLRSISSPPPKRERSNSIAVPARARSNSVFAPPPRERANSIFAIPVPRRERSNSIYKDKGAYSLNKIGLQRREELDEFLKHRGFSSEELDSIVQQFHQIQEQLEGGEWVTKEEFKAFMGVREQELSDQLFDVFKQSHKMHNFRNLDFCPSPQMSREKPVGADGVEMDAINLREFLCGLLLLQSSDVDKKLRMVFDLYNENGNEITRDSLRNMMIISAKENKITLSDEQLDTVVDNIFRKMDTTGSDTITFKEFRTAFQESPMEVALRPQNTPLTDFLHINKASPASPIKPFSWTINLDEPDVVPSSSIGSYRPDFVEKVYEDEDVKRNNRKSQSFEAREKTNYIPQQEPMPATQKVKAGRKFRTKLHASGGKYGFLTLFALINIGFFAWDFILYAFHTETINIVGWGVPLARGFAQLLKIDCALLLIPVARNLMTYLRATPIHRILPIDKNISFHKVTAIMVVVGSIGHWAAHLSNFYYISNASLEELQTINPTYFTSVPSYAALNFLTIPGLTGYIMLIALVVIFAFARKSVRRQTFERFYITHYFFVVFYAALIIHGMSHILGAWEVWKWVAGPVALYLIDRLLRLHKQQRGVKILDVTILPGDALMLKMEIPSRTFNYKSGQYIFLNFRSISFFEWHPFTLTSAPHEDHISCHIRAAGNWTRKVLELCKEMKGNNNFRVNVDGPYGSATEHVFQYKHVIMIGAGIGVTPFASVLKRIRYRFENKNRKPIKLEKVHFFWTCREQGAFQWFADILSQIEADKNVSDSIELNTFLTGALAQHDIRSILLWYGLEQEYATHNVDLVTGLSSRTYWGRPSYERIIEFLFSQYPKEEVGVFFCGPSPLAHELRKHCKKYASVNGSTFYFHKENF